MKYIGSKNRFAKELLPIILKDRTPEQWYIEPFAGGMNMIDKVTGKRLANDLHFELIEMWKSFVYKGFKPDFFITKDDYKKIRDNKSDYKSDYLGWVGFGCSFSGDYFNGGCAGVVNTKTGVKRNYQAEALRNILKQVPKLNGVEFSNLKYNDLEIPDNSLIYCDPPYKGTTSYNDREEFNHIEFWEWVRLKTKQGHKVFVSEYKAPEDFKCVWEKETKSSLSANGKSGGNKLSTEKLFVYCG